MGDTHELGCVGARAGGQTTRGRFAGGWCTTDFLDFLGATGDAVTHIRVMLPSAFPLRRLGRH